MTKRYAAKTAVDDISFEVHPREILGFLGPNGAGKSTTLRILTGYLAATSGRVTVNGRDVFKEPGAVKRATGYMPETVPLYPEMRVEEYLSYRAALKKVPRARRRKAVDSTLERCRIGDVRRSIIGQLSKGYRQRVGLADSLVADPEILVLDEPTIGLDPNQIRQTRELIRELGCERTVILSSHILPEVEAVCSRVLIINKGRLVGQGRPDELRAAMTSREATIELEVRDPAGVAAATFKAVQGVRQLTDPTALGDNVFSLTLKADPDPGVRERLFDATVANGMKLRGLAARSFTLEDVFVQITTSEAPAEEPAAPEATGGAA
ncbi:MAG: ATP-binding cassette domain-containing protein [Deltaproteobacteria bacterium]|nr:ATP-binding cassette domain-containing protein [Deltaproteobacteria bacterium]